MSVEGAVPSARVETAVVDAENPWPGLASFGEPDAAFFHGRSREIADLERLVLRERLTVLFGRSGLGKTSLLRAGLFPRLREQDILPVYIRLNHSDDGPDLCEQITGAVLDAAVAAGVEAPRRSPHEALWEYFHRQGADFWSPRNRPVTPALVIDQFEEIFTLAGSPKRAEKTCAFLDELADLIEGRPPTALRRRLDGDPGQAKAFTFDRHAYKVLLSLREDYLPDLEGLRDPIRSIATNRMRLLQMDGAAALCVMRQSGSHLVEEGVGRKVVRFVAGSVPKVPARSLRGTTASDSNSRADVDEPLEELKVEPALLSVVCRELNNRRRQHGDPRITADLLQESKRGILSDFYDECVRDLEPEVPVFIQERLLTVSGHRDSFAYENALAEIGGNAIRRLVDRRLLRIEQWGAVQRVELTHDVLADVVSAARERRRAAEREEKARRAAEEHARHELRKSRIRIAAVAAAVLVLILIGSGILVLRYVQRRERAKVWMTSLLWADPDRVPSLLAEILRDGPEEFSAAWSVVTGREDSVVGNALASLAATFQEQESFRIIDRVLLELEEHPTTDALESELEVLGALAWVVDFVDASGANMQIDCRSLRGRIEGLLRERFDLPPPELLSEERWVKIDGGTFRMGSAYDDAEALGDERPSHPVTVGTFWVMQHEVTNEDYRAFPGRVEGDDRAPVVRVTWFEAYAYAAWLGGRLPTEAEWEYACRAGTSTRYWSGDEESDLNRVGWYKANSNDHVHRVGEKSANPWGLYDIHGNVWEWVVDVYDSYAVEERTEWVPYRGSWRLVRGGGFDSSPRDARAARRAYMGQEGHAPDAGFRVVRTVAPNEGS